MQLLRQEGQTILAPVKAGSETLKEIVEVTRVEGYKYNSTDRVNQLLSEGWVLLAIPVLDDGSHIGYEYILGWPEPTEEAS